MKPNVEFLHTSFYEAVDNPKEIVCDITARILLKKIGMDSITFYKIVKKRFPDVSSSGVFSVTAKSVCGENDNFDERTGEMIAETKAQEKVYAKASRIYTEIYNWFARYTNNLADITEHCFDLALKANLHVRDIDEQHNGLNV